MRFDPAIAVAAIGAILITVGGTVMGEAKAPTAAVTVEKAAGPLEISVKTDGGGVTYFGGVFLEFGDGQRQLICGPGQGCRSQRVAHQYERAGTYTIKMVGLGEPDQKPLAETTVTVPLK